MARIRRTLGKHFRRLWAPYAVLALSITPTVAAYVRLVQAEEAHRKEQFRLAMETVKGRIDLHFTFYLALLSGMRGLFAASEEVVPSEMGRYLDSLDIRSEKDGEARNLPGLRELGFALRVRPEDLEAQAVRLRANGFTNFHPVLFGGASNHFSTVYLDDFRREVMVPSGEDLSEDPIRREALDRAADLGDAVATAPRRVRGAGEGSWVPGFELYLPVYQGGTTPKAVEERRRQLTGFVFATFTSEPFWSALEDTEHSRIHLLVCDGPKLDSEHRIYPVTETAALGRHAELYDGYSTDGLGRVWTFFYFTGAAFEAGGARYIPLATLLAGGVLGLGLTAVTAMVLRHRHRAERMAAELRESDSRFRGIFEAIQDLYLRTDARGVLTQVSPSCESILGYLPSELVGRPLRLCFPDRTQRHGTVRRLATLGKLEDHEARLRRKDGREIAVSITAHLLPGADERSVGAEGILRDISVRKRLEAEELRVSKLESVGVLAGGIAHDFNNLLTAMLGNLALARAGSSAEAGSREYHDEIERAALRARDLTQQLLTFAKGGAPVRQTASLRQIIRESAGFALSGSKVSCEYQVSKDLWPVEVDPGQINQVIHNLVLNAVQAMPHGGTLTICAENEGVEANAARVVPRCPRVCLSIIDTGSGISPEHLPRVFDPYFTTKPTGNGLGLATVHSIIRRHEGRIEVESRPGQGTTFRIWLAASPSAKILAAEVTRPARPGSGRILVVDDEDAIRVLTGRLLQRLGYEALGAANGGEALEVLGREIREGRPVHAAVLDLTLPGGPGGRELLPALRELDPTLKAIVSSGYSEDAVLSDPRAHGFDGVLVKPYQMESLAHELERLLGARPRV